MVVGLVLQLFRSFLLVASLMSGIPEFMILLGSWLALLTVQALGSQVLSSMESRVGLPIPMQDQPLMTFLDKELIELLL